MAIWYDAGCIYELLAHPLLDPAVLEEAKSQREMGCYSVNAHKDARFTLFEYACLTGYRNGLLDFLEHAKRGE